MKERKMTVSSIFQPNRRPEPVASIRLTGRWVEALGFETGKRFVVKERPGRIELIVSDAESLRSEGV